ncbi:hypothetical protein QF038_001858 [Pseudarthrobacter sp. W1I19]|uniref:hypothetical protein n=1 Tax=Pseudarthrobacter sp. W1I19 TaxID=3042288 RepID=UPI0027821042|nr:hypothetical protein [Pseudarthrobacter sp. W1I19]MDQ0923350.1 hypothetical protein [Pseudarthrobacter sp. W1I19]
MNIKRTIVDTKNGPALVQQIPGISIQIIGAVSEAEVDPTDADWKDMHKKLKTGKLDFATVKKEHGITEVQSN